MPAITVELDESGARIALKGWIGPETPALCKRIGGGRFSPERKVWLYPLTLPTCRRMRDVFGDRLGIGPKLNAWAREAVAAEKALATLSAATDADLRHVPEFAPRVALAMASRSYQRVAAAFGARVGSFLLADQPGLGKTLETLGAIVERDAGEPGLHLVLSPSVAVNSVWGREIAQWLGPAAYVVTLTGTRAQREEKLSEALAYATMRETLGEHVFIVGNIEMARIRPRVVDDKPVFDLVQRVTIVPGELFDAGTKKEPAPAQKVRYMETGPHYPALFRTIWDTVVVDESQRALIRTSGKPTQQRAGMMALAKASKHRIALSGTPMRGKPEQLWGTLNWLYPRVYTSYWNWIAAYWQLSTDGYSEYVLDGFQPDGDKRLSRDSAGIMLRRTKGEVLTELPPKTYSGTYLVPGDVQSPHGVWLEMTPAQDRQYAKLMRDGVIVGDNDEEIIINGVLPQDMRRKQLCGAAIEVVNGTVAHEIKYGGVGANSAKFEWLAGKLGELGIRSGKDDEGDARIVVASQFTRLLDAFETALRGAGVRTHKITGAVPMKRRDAMVADFQSDAPTARVFLINTQAAGVAITLDRADDLVLLDETWIPDDQEQVEDRIHRASRIHNVTIHTLRMLDTIEEEIAWITAAREDAQKYILDGSRGVSYARQVYEESRKTA